MIVGGCGDLGSAAVAHRPPSRSVWKLLSPGRWAPPMEGMDT